MGNCPCFKKNNNFKKEKQKRITKIQNPIEKQFQVRNTDRNYLQTDNDTTYETSSERVSKKKKIENNKKNSKKDYHKNTKNSKEKKRLGKKKFIQKPKNNEKYDLKKDNNELNNKVPILENKNEKQNLNLKKEKEKDKIKEKNLNLENKNKDLEKENEKIKQKYLNLENKNKDLEKEKGKIKEKNLNLENEKKEIKKKFAKEIEELKKYCSSIEKECEENKQKYYLLLKSDEDLKSKNKEMKEKEIQFQNNIEVLQNKNEKIIEKYNLLEKENKKLYEENALLKKIPILVGLNNIGATCYMNATLQCLSNTDELTKYFLNKFKFDESDNNKIISNAYFNVIKNLWNRDNNNKSFSPNGFKEKLSKENPLFEGITANDSKDLINFLLERFHNELNIKKENDQNFISNEFNTAYQLNEQKMLEIFTNEFKIKYNSIISNLFYGTLETKSQCQLCKQIKYNFQIFSFIEFPLEKVNQYCFNTGKRNNYNTFNNKNPDIDLYECFEYNNNLELMTGDNQMYCNICNCTCDSLYGSTLYSTPNYLIINLNRGRGAVYECNVNFPEQLNLFNYVSFKMGNTVYELYAVICHIGPSSMSGHFIAFCKNRIDKKWYKYNDAFVTLCQNSNEYRSGMPYILFYKVLLSS